LKSLDGRVFAQSTISESTTDNQTTVILDPNVDGTLTFRTAMLVAALGAGIWYLLWRVSVHLLTAI
jgi:hypothetical protein